jgi:sulfofructose kinase
MERFDVVGLGVSVIDVLQLVDHFPTGEEVQRASAMVLQGGGPVSTAMVTLARLGARVAMLDVVADDWRGKIIRDEFERDGVCTGYLQQVQGCESSLSTVLVRRGSGARTIVYYPGTTPDLSPAYIPREVVQSARFLHLNGRHRQATMQAVAWARAAGVQVSFDGGASLYEPEMRTLIPLVDVCVVAREFALRHTGAPDLHEAARALLAEGPAIVAITDGTQGSWVFTQPGEAFHQPAYLMPRVVDTTGCGDSYHGAFLFGLLRGMSLRETAALASAVAALNSQHLGGRTGLPTLDEAQTFLARVRA